MDFMLMDDRLSDEEKQVRDTVRAFIEEQALPLFKDHYENGTFPESRFNIHSCTKSFSGTAFGLLLEDARRGTLGAGRAVDLDSNAYAHIPAGYPLSDPRKERITLRHLLSMSSGIPGESIGLFGVHAEADVNAFEAALGRFPLRGREVPGDLWAARLAAVAL